MGSILYNIWNNKINISKSTVALLWGNCQQRSDQSRFMKSSIFWAFALCVHAIVLFGHDYGNNMFHKMLVDIKLCGIISQMTELIITTTEKAKNPSNEHLCFVSLCCINISTYFINLMT
jgi:hypothetical protein